LRWLWEWLEYCKVITEREKYRVPSVGTLKFPGARAVLKVDSSPGSTSSPLKSEVINTPIFDVHSQKTYK